MRSTTRLKRSPALLAALLLIGALSSLGSAPAYGAAGDISTAAGNGSSGYSGDGGPAISAELNGPYMVAAGSSGSYYIADPGNNVIRKVDGGGTITTVAGNGSAGYSGDGGPATAASLNGAAAVAVDAAGNLLISDTHNYVVRKVTPGGTISTIAGNGTAGFSGDGGPATAASYGYTFGLTAIGTDVYVSDYGNSVIHKISGGVSTTFAGNGDSYSHGDGGPATAAGIPIPNGIAADTSGNIYVVQTSNNYGDEKVRKIATTGTITTFAGTGAPGFSGDGGPAASADLNNPVGITFDGANNAYISDYFNNRIRRVDGNTGVINTVAGDGTGGYGGDGGSACFAELNGPLGLAALTTGDLVIGDNSNNVVRKVTSPAVCATPVRNVVTDFDRDFHTDISVFRPSGGTWFGHPSSGGGDSSINYGASGDIPVPGDYDGDYRTDVAIFRPSTGLWAIHNSSDATDTFITFGGVPGDVAVPADYDGDGKVDLGIYRPSLGIWYVLRSTDQSVHSIVFGGVSGDIPVPADYDGDGRIDKAIFRPSTGTWFVHPSGADEGDYFFSYGANGDIPVPGDYDGDGKADVAIFRPTTGLWAVHRSTDSTDTLVTYGGIGGDVPIPADYDGDHKYDIAIFRPAYGGWYVHQSTNNADAVTTFGISTDVALQLPAAVRTRFF